MAKPLMLLVDIGNSRVKWATLAHGVLGAQMAAGHASLGASHWRRTLLETRPTRVVVSCVGAPEARDALVSSTREVLGRDPEFVVSTTAAAGVRNGYTDPAQLGVDRWLAVIAAFHQYRGGCCVVDAGTALTIDGVDGSGSHLGGFIVPGPQLMVSSLLDGTSELADRWATSHIADTATLAHNTRDAIEQGGLIAIAGLVAEVCHRLRSQGTPAPALVVTGGAASILMPWLPKGAEHVPDLVLQGLARIVTESPVSPP